jgi:hypothetical protein
LFAGAIMNEDLIGNIGSIMTGFVRDELEKDCKDILFFAANPMTLQIDCIL